MGRTASPRPIGQWTGGDTDLIPASFTDPSPLRREITRPGTGPPSTTGGSSPWLVFCSKNRIRRKKTLE